MVEAIGLEDWVPSKHVLTSWLDNLAIAASGENDRFSLWPLTEGKDALCIGSLVIEVLNHLPEALSAHAAQEVFNVGAWQAIIGIKTETDIFDQNRRVALGCRQFDLVLGDFLWDPLDLHQIEAYVAHLVSLSHWASHDLHELFQLFGVARDECDRDFP